MVITRELDCHVPSKAKRKSYFAFIPILNKREKGKIEKNAIRIIHQSNLCKSHPILRTLLIENVRICCIVVETSGKHSVKFICASAPYIFSLICKANPKLQHILGSEKMSSYVNILQKIDFESLLTNVYQATIFLQKGLNKYYPTACVSLIKDYIHYSEKSVSNFFDLALKVLLTIYEFICDHVMPAFHYLHRLSSKLIRTLVDDFPHVISASVKYSVFLNIFAQKSVVVCFKTLKKIMMCIFHFVNRVHTDSAVKNTIKQLYTLLKLFAEYLCSSDAYKYAEAIFLGVIRSSKPIIWNTFMKAVTAAKKLIPELVPLLKSFYWYLLQAVIPSLREMIRNNKNDLIDLCKKISEFLYENFDSMKLVFQHIFYLLYRCVIYLSDATQAALPIIIEFSSAAVIFITSCIVSISESCIRIAVSLSKFSNSDVFRRFICFVFRWFIRIFKTMYEIVVGTKPCMSFIFSTLFSGTSKVIHELSPTLKAITYEMNSSVYYASNEVVSKSFLAVKRITPSVWYTAKTVVPPTIVAANEIFNSSKNSLIIISPAVLQGLLAIRPELQECIFVLFSDGNKACLEVASVSYSASCEIKDAAKTVSTSIPVIFKAVREVMMTTTYAAIEVGSTSLSAKCKVRNDLKNVRHVVSSSVTLAEQEILAAYTAASLEINCILGYTGEDVAGENKYKISKYIDGVLDKFCTICSLSLDNLNNVFKNAFHVLYRLTESTTITLQDSFEDLLHLSCYLISVVYKLCLSLTHYDVLNFVFRMLDNIFKLLNNINFTEGMPKHVCEKLLNINAVVMYYACITICKLWNISKSCLRTSWYEICQQAPELWAMLEHLSARFWNYTVNHTPVVWKSWKNFCFAMWEMVCCLTPHVWHYLLTAVPVLWRSERELVRTTWSLFVTVSSLIWHRTTSLTSEYWLLCINYVPQVWFVGCEETKSNWNFACRATEKYWNFTMNTCLLSWSLFHNSVAGSWRKGLNFTRKAYTLCTSAGSAVKKSVCFCNSTKNYFFVVLEVVPHTSVLNVNSSSAVKTKHSDDDDNDLHLKTEIIASYPESAINSTICSSEKSSVRKKLRRYIFSYVSSFAKVSARKLVNCEEVIPSVISNKYLLFNKLKTV